MTTKETVTWIPVEIEKPANHDLVLADCKDGIQFAMWNGELWRNADTAVPLEDVHHWAAMPTGANP